MTVQLPLLQLRTRVRDNVNIHYPEPHRTPRENTKLTLVTALNEMDLSDRERQVVALVALGYTNREIAKRLHVAHATVASHLQRVYARTGAASRFDLAVMAVIAGLIQFEQIAEVAVKRAEVNRLVNSFDW